MPETLPIIFRDEYLVAINKPSGLLVHRSEIDRHETRFALQLVRDQIGQMVYPVHLRLQKKWAIYFINISWKRPISL
jgi:tRNA pseudouridine65 synthase